jgi:hypothetical protein
MNIIISCIHYPVSSGRYMADAFRRLGCEVRTLGDSTGNRIPWGQGGWLELDPKYTWHSDGDLTKQWDNWTPDLIVHMDSAFAYHHPVYANVPHVVYGADNHVRDYRQAGIARYFLMHKNATLQPYDENTEHLPCGYDPHYFTPSSIPWARRGYDVALVGVMYPRRVELLDALHKAGLKVFAGTGFVYDQYATIYHNSRISLCVSAAGDLAQRVFETAAMGCAILTDPLADLEDRETNLKLGLQAYATYTDTESAVTLARELLDSARAENIHVVDENEAIMQIAGGAGGLSMGEFAAQRMQECVVGKHTWDMRAVHIVQWFKETYGKQKAEIRDIGNIESNGVLVGAVGGGSNSAVPARDGRTEPVEETAQAKETPAAHEEDLRHVTVDEKSAKPKRKKRGQ